MSYLTIDSTVAVLGPILFAIFFLPIFLLFSISKTLTRLSFSILYPPLINYLRSLVQFVIEDLFEDISKETSRDGQGIKILEIGIGPAVNFKFYPKNSRIIALDINPNFEKLVRKKAQDSGITLETFIVGSAENLSFISSGSIDVVVGTYVLCHVPKPEKAISEIYRVLKAGGKCYSLEHVEFRNRGLIRIVQKIVQPFHKVIWAGCRFNSNIQELFEKNHFNVSELKYLEIQKMALTLSPHLYGKVTKQ